MNKLSDEQLVRRYLKKKDESALEDLISRYLPVIYGYARRYVGDGDTAADIAQETFVKAWKNLKKFDSGQSFKNWIFTIAKRTALDWLKQKSALPFSFMEKENDDMADRLIDDRPSIFEQLSRHEAAQKMTLALACLPASYSSVIHFHLNKEMSFRKISRYLQEPLNTVKSRYRRGIILLKKIMGQN